MWNEDSIVREGFAVEPPAAVVSKLSEASAAGVGTKNESLTFYSSFRLIFLQVVGPPG